MVKYLYRDMVSTMEYLPNSLALGVPAALLLLWILGRGGPGKKKGPASGIPAALYTLYLAILLVITFFSRESGSRVGAADLELFSTWGINDRNNAFVVENVLLFIPYGFLSAWALPWAGGFFGCALFGAATSVAVEWLQKITGRGYFQIDDILTNLLGTVMGFLLFWLFFGRRGKARPADEKTPDGPDEGPRV